MASTIIHLSDIHIRTGDKSKSRYEEYVSVFESLFSTIQSIEAVINNTAVIVITGDFFHNKNRLESSGLKIALHLLSGLAAIAPTYIIRGNHDYRQDTPTEDDLLSALTAYPIPNITYLDKTGHYEIGQIGFGLVAIQDTLLYGANHGVTANLPQFPDPTKFSQDIRHKVALFHGSITHARLQNGYELTETTSGYPIEWFNGYDCILLGDIHLQQIHRTDSYTNKNKSNEQATILKEYKYSDKNPWAYPGSLIQQDFGESILGHGFLQWNLETREVSEYHIHNPYGYISLYRSDTETSVMHRKDGKSRWVPLSSIVSQPWFPNTLKVRVSGKNVSAETLRSVTEELQNHGKQILQITELSISHISSLTPNSENSESEIPDIRQLTSPEMWIQYIQNSSEKLKNSDEWKEWLLHPERIIVPISGIPEKTLKKIQERNDLLIKKTEVLRSEIDTASSGTTTNRVCLNYMEWNWMLNYKDGNYFDFDSKDKQICIFSAKNGNGKSNFLEIISIALFGEGFPSRHNTSYASSIICDKKPEKASAGTYIEFTVNDIKYSIERVLGQRTTMDRYRSIRYNSIVLYALPEKRIVHQGKSAVDTWIETNLGTAGHFYMSTMLTQNADNDFFSSSKKEQKELLDNVLSLNPIKTVEELLKDSKNAHKFSIDLLEAFASGLSTRSVSVREAHEKLTVYRQELVDITLRKTELSEKWNHIPEKLFKESTESLEARLLVLEKQLRSVPSGDISDITESRFNVKSRFTELTRLCPKTSLSLSLSDFQDSGIPNSKTSRGSVELEFGSSWNSNSDENIILELSEKVATISSLLKSHPFYKTRKIETNRTTKVLCPTSLEIPSEEYLQQLCIRVAAVRAQKAKWIELFRGRESILETDISVYESLLEEKQSIVSDSDKLNTLISECDVVKETTRCKSENIQTLLFRKPNKPKWTDAMIRSASMCLEGTTIQSLTEKRDRLQHVSQHQPSLETMIQSLDREIEYAEKTISEGKKIPFNPSCKACIKQPWKVVASRLEEQLPVLVAKKGSVVGELTVLVGDTDLVTIKKDIQECNALITKTERLAEETVLSEKYREWTDEYERQTAELAGLGVEVKESQGRLSEFRKLMADAERQIPEIQKNVSDLRAYSCRTESDDCGLVAELEDSWLTLIYTDQYLYVCVRTESESLNVCIAELDGRLQTLKEAQRVRTETEEARAVLAARPSWSLWKGVSITERGIVDEIASLERIVRESAEGLETAILDMNRRLLMLEEMAECFKGFRAWLYKDKMAPLIQAAVNGVLRGMTCDRPLFLEAEWLPVVDTLSWFLRDGTSRPIIEKASGFQRFIAGISMRVAMGKLGICKTAFVQLFIDEGFTACDSDNLERVPGFLRGLLKSYRTVYLATHLEELKGCADSKVVVERVGGLAGLGVGRCGRHYVL